jgi:ATP-dependent helicase HepA
MRIRLMKTLKADASNPKIVVFASSAKAALAFHEAFSGRFDDIPVYLLTESDEEKMSEATSAFVAPHVAAILVTDWRGEEGLNLNCADAIVHLDLPLSAARLEQRIGRLDRFGRRRPRTIFLRRNYRSTPAPMRI